MSNYSQTTFFTPKDTLPANNPAKTIFGAAYDVEFGNISSAIASKPDNLTVASHLNVNVTGNTIPQNGIYLPAANTLGFATNTTLWWEISNVGGLSNIAPSSGVALTVNGFAGANVITATTGSAAAVAYGFSTNAGTGMWSSATSNLDLATAGTDRVNINGSGNVTINAPSSGTVLAMTSASGSASASVNIFSQAVADAPYIAMGRNLTAEAYIGVVSSGGPLLTGATNGDLALRGSAAGVSIGSGSATAIRIASTGAVTINAPSSGTPLTVNGVANNDTLFIVAPNTASQSFGLDIRAGTSSSDYGLVVVNAAVTQTLLKVFGDGGVTIGSPTGGDEGAGTINVSGGYFVNGAAVFANGTFTGTYTGITGTPTGTLRYTIDGQAVTLYIPTNTANSTATTFTITGLPAAIQPIRTQNVPIDAYSFDDGGLAQGTGTITAQVTASSGTLTFLKGGSASGWTNSATLKGVASACSITYFIG